MLAMRKPTVLIGLLGPVLDGGHGHLRWERWRPTVAVCQQDDLLIDRFEMLAEPKFTSLRDRLVHDLSAISPETEVRTHAVDWADPWDFQDVYAALHDFAAAYPWRPEAEDYLVHMTTGTHVAQICLFLLVESRRLPARLIQTSPPSRWGTGPGSYSVIDLDLSKYDKLASRFAVERAAGTSFLKDGIETRNEKFNRLIDRIEQVAIHSRAAVLLTGPTGAGKGRLARRIYELKRHRRQMGGPFVEVNCATLRGDGAMSALFGHVRGAFTGALKDRPGLLKSADGGLLFLDEIGELGPDEQAMLLRALEEKRFLPVGSDAERTSDFQLIAGTNRDLPAAVRGGRFRDDLLARINLWTFGLPSLRDRPEDVEPNLDYELARFAESNGRTVAFNREAREQFLTFATGPSAAWAGNFRDLNAAVVRTATLAAGGRITAELVAEEVARLTAAWSGAADDPASNPAGLLDPAALAELDPFDAVQLAEVVRVCRRCASLSEAGRVLFRASRLKKRNPNDADRLRKYLARFGLEWERLRA